MTQLEALKELAEKVESGIEPNATDVWNVVVFESDKVKGTKEVISWAFHGYLDAAHSLHKALLGDRWSISLTQDDAKTWWCVLKEGFQTSYTGVNGATQETPARAWLLAIIKAKISELEL